MGRHAAALRPLLPPRLRHLPEQHQRHRARTGPATPPRTRCGPSPPAPPPTTVWSDTFETATGWTTNPAGTDTATTGVWERGDPAATTSSGAKQLGTTVSGVNDLVTGRAGGHRRGRRTTSTAAPPASARRPSPCPPAARSTLSLSWYLAHGSNSSSADFFRVSDRPQWRHDGAVHPGRRGRQPQRRLGHRHLEHLRLRRPVRCGPRRGGRRLRREPRRGRRRRRPDHRELAPRQLGGR